MVAASSMKRLSHFVHSAIYRSPRDYLDKYIISKGAGKGKKNKIRIKCENAWDTIEIRSGMYYIMDCQLALNDNEC